MAKLEENVMLSEWVSPSASPRTIMGGFIVGSQEQMFNQDIKREDVAAANGGQWTELGSNNEQKSSLLQRRAARAGFNAPMLDTENISCTRVSLNQDQAPYITVSPGLSPTTLLESPVFLSNSLAPSSPTTGKISFIQNGNVKSSMLLPDEPDERNDNTYEDIGASPFPFKTESGSDPSLYFCALGAGNEVTSTTSLPQSCRGIGILSHPENMLQSYGAEPPKVQSETKNSLYYSSEFPKLVAGKDRIGDSIQQPDHIELEAFGGHVKHSPTSDEQPDEGGQRGSGESMAPAGGTPSEDGYNWRKYGQKQVKGSEYPRSYYKCTHLNCPVKKKVERSHEGHITEIIYKGAHNHPKPLPNRRAGIGLSNPLMDLPLDASEQTLPVIGSDGNPLWPNMHDNLEVTSKASLEHEFGHPSSSMKALNSTNSADAAAASSTFSNDDDDDEAHGSVGYGGEDDEFDSKRRKLDSYPSEIGGTNRALREPRIVVQVSTDVDILEDGYRWRKYGQKVVKGNPNPRSYYKCTSAGCTVRKHVERASHDLKAVITTYEGKHNHDVPAARNSSHVNPTNSSTMPVHTMNAVQSHIQRPETSQVHNSMARYDLPAAFGPPYGLPGRQQLRSTPNYPYGMNQPGLANLTMAGLGPRQSKMPSMPVHPLIAQHQPLSEMGFMMPKPELKVEPVTEPNLNLENTPSVYQQIMNRLPLGP